MHVMFLFYELQNEPQCL